MGLLKMTKENKTPNYRIKQRESFIDLEEYPKDFSPSHKRLLSNRKIPVSDIKKPLSNLLSVSSLKGCLEAGEIIYKHIQNPNHKIVVLGDYDADGATSTCVVLKVLQFLGCNISSFIPNRIDYGYGLSDKAVKKILELNPTLVITVDNGIRSVSEIKILREQGIDVVLTDHHLPANELPPANIIVNPQQIDCKFQSKNIAGVGVAFYVMLGLRAIFKQENNKRLDEFDFTSLLGFVAIGTISDLVKLDYNNRILVEQGLKRIRKGVAGEGINALISTSKIDQESISSIEIAFTVSPKINAAGRIADMSLGVDCLLAKSDYLAMDYALELTEINNKRKIISKEMQDQATLIIKDIKDNKESQAICLFDENWHEGILGILSSSIKKEYKKVCFIFTKSGNLLKASARSIDAVNLIKVLNEINKTIPNLLITYGGHSKAAGVTINEDRFLEFESILQKIVTKTLENKQIDNNIYTDASLLSYEFDIDNANFIKNFEVWGQGVPEPIFNNTFHIKQVKLAGNNHAKMLLIEENSNKTIEAIAFGKYDKYCKLSNDWHNIAYRLTTNYWQGRTTLFLIVLHIEDIKK